MCAATVFPNETTVVPFTPLRQAGLAREGKDHPESRKSLTVLEFDIHTPDDTCNLKVINVRENIASFLT